MNYETTAEMEMALANHFGIRKNVIVPNVSWGMFNYELDLCVLNYTTLYASEVEIKISKSDLKADNKKSHHHDLHYNLIKYLWFAMPGKMADCENLVPANAGILIVNNNGFTHILRRPAINKDAKKWDYESAFKLARLGMLRIWDLKKTNKQINKNYHYVSHLLDDVRDAINCTPDTPWKNCKAQEYSNVEHYNSHVSEIKEMLGIKS